jgi:hypothetical protein
MTTVKLVLKPNNRSLSLVIKRLLLAHFLTSATNMAAYYRGLGDLGKEIAT